MSKNEFDALLLKKLQEEAFEFDPKSWQQLSDKLNMPAIDAGKIPSFDAMLHEKLAEDAFEYKPQSWQQLSQKLADPILETEEKEERKVLPFASGKKWKIALGTAAAICMLIALGITLHRSDKNELDKAPSIAHKSVINPVIKADENKGNNTPVSLPSPQQNVATATSSPNNASQSHSIKASKNVIVNTPQNVVPTLLNNAPTANTPSEKQIAVQPEPKENDVHLFNKKLMESAPKPQPSNAEMALKNANDNWPGNYQQTGNATHRKAPTHIALGGGVNYGNLNTGYTAGVTVKRKISNDFYVDGTVAMLYNNNANNVAVNNGPPITGPVAARPANAMSSISSPSLDPIQRLYYVQVNPSVGYQVEDKIGVSVGGDFQRMLGGNDEVVQPQSDNTKIFPTLDVGITTKTEFTITPNLQAGVVYREGINNLINSDAGKYVNRRYLQVQFKYNIPMGGK